MTGLCRPAVAVANDPMSGVAAEPVSPSRKVTRFFAASPEALPLVQP